MVYVKYFVFGLFSQKKINFLVQDTMTNLKNVYLWVKNSISFEDKFLILYAIDPGHSELNAISPGFIYALKSAFWDIGVSVLEVCLMFKALK